MEPSNIKEQPTATKEKNNKKEKNIINCYCYNESSIDSRCCGVCYCWYSTLIDRKEQCYICPYTLSEYWNSGYIQTNGGDGDANERCGKDECSICCVICFPLKFTLFFSCLLGASFNHCIDCIRCSNVEHNYLF